MPLSKSYFVPLTWLMCFLKMCFFETNWQLIERALLGRQVCICSSDSWQRVWWYYRRWIWHLRQKNDNSKDVRRTFLLISMISVFSLKRLLKWSVWSIINGKFALLWFEVKASQGYKFVCLSYLVTCGFSSPVLFLYLGSLKRPQCTFLYDTQIGDGFV